MSDDDSNLGQWLALIVGIGLIGAAIVLGITGGDTVGVTILALIGASALGGYVRARRER